MSIDSRQSDRVHSSTLVETPWHLIQELLKRIAADDPPQIKSISLFYLRQVAFKPLPWIPLWPPEFLYVCDVNRSALAVVAIPYELPVDPVPNNPNGPERIGFGDPFFPVMDRAKVLSAAGDANQDLMYPCVAGQLVVTPMEGTDEDELRRELQPFVYSILNTGSTYLAQVRIFEERSVAEEIKKNVSKVRFVVPNQLLRNSDHPWLINQVM